MLNASKGPAVRGPRAQMDRLLYKREVQRLLADVPGLTIHDGAVVDLLVDSRPGSSGPSSSNSSSSSSSGNRAGSGSDASALVGGPAVAGVVLASGERILCRSVVVTTGTFLRGVIHIGSQSRPAGRVASLIATRAASKADTAAAAVRDAESTDTADEMAAGAATRLAQRFDELGFKLGRLKTGTPPRLDGERDVRCCTAAMGCSILHSVHQQWHLKVC
jgi:tRNA uridine 5-carboxymethylaminomethyl modification enzyme